MFNSISSFATNFDVSYIHSSAGDIARIVAMSITPVLLVLAIYTRILQDSLDTFGSSGPGVWARAVRDFVVWGVVLASYFAIGALIVKFANDIYRWADTVGGLKLITQDMSAAAAFVDEKLKSETGGSRIVRGLITGGGTLSFITALFYYLSLLIAAFLVIALKIAHALTFGLAFIWGLIAIPISVSKGIKLLRGWALLLGFALAWPLIQALLLAIIRPSFIMALNSVMTNTTNAGVDILSGNLLMTVLNLIFAATVVAAPYVASTLVSNAPSAGAMVTPFISAAMTGIAGVVGGAKMSGEKLIGGSKTGASRLLGDDAASATTKKAAGSFGMSSNPGGNAGRSDSGASAPAAVNVTTPAASGSTADGEAKQKQQRRGIIINQNQRKNK